MKATFEMCDECLKPLVSDLKTIGATVTVSDLGEENACDFCGEKKSHTVTVEIDAPRYETRGYEIHYGDRFDGCVEFGDFEWFTETEHFYIFGGQYFLYGDLAFYNKDIVKEVLIIA